MTADGSNKVPRDLFEEVIGSLRNDMAEIKEEVSKLRDKIDSAIEVKAQIAELRARVEALEQSRRDWLSIASLVIALLTMVAVAKQAGVI